MALSSSAASVSAALYHLVEGLLSLVGPVPRVLKGFNLSMRLFASRRTKQDVVVRVRVERGIEIDEVNALIFDVLPKDAKVVAVIEAVHVLQPITGRSSINEN
jgi:hypothetical protein